MQTDHIQPWHRRWAAVLGVLLAFTLVATACGDDGDSGQEAPAPTEATDTAETPEPDSEASASEPPETADSDAAPEEAPEEAPEPSDQSDGATAADEPAEPAEPVSIDYAGFGLADEDIELELVRQFEAANPNIRVSDVDMLTSKDYWPRMEALAAAGDLPCVMWMNSGFVDGWILDDLIVDIQAYVDQLDHSLYQIGDFAGMRNPQTGNMHAFPFRFGGSVLYYNATLFEEAGLPLPAPGWTWDDFLTAAQALTLDENGDGTPERYGHYFYGRYAHVENWVYQNNGRLLNAERTVFEPDANAVAALQFLDDLIHVHGVSPEPKEFDGIGDVDIFAGQLSAMWIDGTWNIDNIQEAAGSDFEWSVTAIPRGPQASSDVAFGWPDLLAISANCENPDAAWEFIEFMTGPARTPELQSIGQLPVYLPTAQDPDLAARTLPASQDFLVEWAGLTGPTTHSPGWGEWRGYTDGSGLQGQLDLVFNGEKSLQDALADAGEFANAVLDREWGN